MALDGDSKPAINIIRRKKVVHAGHSGAWKVAYADFVTAMMSLFIVLWCVGQSKQVKDYVAHYFRDPAHPYDFSNRRVSILVTPMTNDATVTAGEAVDTM
ncbi:MAG: hypothetical protein M1378_12375, partial [Bacteroidetes bacterium]|nr:hypothetical protein [Bacteroidota bacterium]